ncbi:hypothetical protein KKC44_05275 [Patescibacteria group bacterium]|nr:hypothetical protein [Patescibacteria group bacterium]
MTCPKLLQPFWKAWCTFSNVLGRVMSFIILTILWLVLFGIYAIILKILSIHKLWKKPPDTYWVDPLLEVPNGMHHQF